MGFTPQSGQVGFRIQEAPGVYSDPGESGSEGIFMRLKSGSLSGKRDMIIPDPEIGGDRDIPDAYLGPIIFSGEYEFYARTESLPTLLYAALGDKASTSAGSGATLVGTHILTPADALPALSIEEKIANGYEVFNYIDAFVSSLHLECEVANYIMGTVSIIALQQTAGETATAVPDWDLTPLMVGTNVDVLYNSVALPAKKWSFDVNNNIEDNDFRLGSVFAGDATPKRREVTSGVTIRPADSALWRQATYGSAAATSAQAGAVTKQAISVVAESYENIASSSTKHLIQLAAPKVAIKPFEVKPSGDDVVEHDIELQFLRPDPSLDIVTFTVKNHLAEVL